MFGLTTKKKYNIALNHNKNLTRIALENVLDITKLRLNNLDLKEELRKLKSKEFRKQELEQYFAEARLNGLTPREHLEASWKEYQSLFEKKACETKEDLKKDRKTNEILNKIVDSIDTQDKNKESLLKSVKEILDWYKSEELQFTPESKNDIKDMFLNLEIAYKNMIGTFGVHKSDSEEIIKEI